MSSSEKEASLRKWFVLCLCIASSFGLEFSFDSPAVLKDLLAQHFSSIYDTKHFEIYYSLFYSCAAIPNIIAPFVIGYFIDKLGVRILLSMLAVSSILGQFLVSLGVQHVSLAMIYPGRMILGIAGESMPILQGIFLNQYFSKSQMSFVMGGIYSVANLGSMLNFYYTPRIAIYNGLPYAFWVGSALCGVIGVFTLTACYFDRRTEMETKEQEKRPAIDSDEEVTLFEENQEIGRQIQAKDEEVIEEFDKNIACFDLKELPQMFWYICIGTMLTQASIQSFGMIGTSYITDKWFSNESIKAASQDSGMVFSMFKLSSFIFSPVLGYIVDKTQERSLFFMFACIITLFSHIMMTITRPLLPCMLLGMAYTLVYTTCWPSIMNIVKKDHVGRACGLVTSLENVGMVIFPIFDGWLKNMSGSYDNSQMFLAFIALIGMLLSMTFYRLSSVEEEKRMALDTSVDGSEYDGSDILF